MNCRAVVFDMDGVLIDSENHWIPREKVFAEEIKLFQADKFVHKIVGLHLKEMYKVAKEEFQLRMDFDEFQQNYLIMAEKVYTEDCNWIPGVEALICELKKRNIPIALATSSNYDWLNFADKRFNFRKLFDVVLSGDDLGGKAKPDPAIYLEACKRLQVSPQESIAIEDSRNGVESAVSAGLFTIGFQSHSSQDISRADILMKDFREISEFILKNINKGS